MLPVFFLFVLLLPPLVSCDAPKRKTFIVHVSPTHKPTIFSSHKEWHASMLASISADPPSSHLYTYNNAASAFSALLTPLQSTLLRRHPSVLSLFPDQPHHLHTTHSPSFLHLPDSPLWPLSHFADDIVVAVLDTGISPHNPSFSDSHLPPPPSTWSARCTTSQDFPSCSRKIIAAYSFSRGYQAAMGHPIDTSFESDSPRDTDGHGTHTASTIAGSPFPNASLFGYAPGLALGMAPRARLAVYKICWTHGCYDSDILAAMDQAVADGVHLISLSVGASSPPPYAADSIAVGAFAAVKRNILVSCSAGNSGPAPLTAVNIAPWILTVGASTMDREFPADVFLAGEEKKYLRGVSLYSPTADTPPSYQAAAGGWYPLVDAAACGDRLCRRGRLTPSCAAGKVVVCDRGVNARVDKGYAVKLSGGVGMVLANTEETGEELVADAHLIPAAAVGAAAAGEIKNYIASAIDPSVKIVFRGTVIGGGNPPAPAVAAFSSRGPAAISPEILKPDIVAPGVGILGGWTDMAGPTGLKVDRRLVDYNIISGTSMACPHVTGIAALLRKVHPQWSPAALKSALLTTASGWGNMTDLATGLGSTPWAHGLGHVDPGRALDPGLIYDISPDEYVGFLLAAGYSDSTVAVITGSPVTARPLESTGDLNYPSFSVIFRSGDDVVTCRRRVTNVGDDVDVVYEAVVGTTGPFRIVVRPRVVRFSAAEKTAEYSVMFQSLGEGVGGGVGRVEWRDGRHVVFSPVVVQWKLDVDSVAVSM